MKRNKQNIQDSGSRGNPFIVRRESSNAAPTCTFLSHLKLALRAPETPKTHTLGVKQASKSKQACKHLKTC